MPQARGRNWNTGKPERGIWVFAASDFLSVLRSVADCSDDSADYGGAEDGQAARFVVVAFQVRRRRRRRRRAGARSGSVVAMRRCGRMMPCDRVPVLLRRLGGRGFLVLPGRRRGLAAAAMGGRRHGRAAKGDTRESCDCHCLDLVHVTPTFPRFLRLHRVRGRGARFLTEKISTDVLGLSVWRRTAETFVKHDRLPLYFAKSQVWPLFVERKNDIIQMFSLRVVVP